MTVLNIVSALPTSLSLLVACLYRDMFAQMLASCTKVDHNPECFRYLLSTNKQIVSLRRAHAGRHIFVVSMCMYAL